MTAPSFKNIPKNAMLVWDDTNSQWIALTQEAFSDIVTAIGGFNIGEYDYISVAYPDTTSEVYTFKTGGAGGTTVGTITITYTDATKDSLSTVVLT